MTIPLALAVGVVCYLAGCTQQGQQGGGGGAGGPAATSAGSGGPAGGQAQKPQAGKQAEKEAAAGHEEAASGESSENEKKIEASLAKLSPEDRAAAEKQKVCPVSGERLGLMGPPVKVTVKGKTVFLCCKNCEKAIKKDPDKYLAKLGK